MAHKALGLLGNLKRFCKNQPRQTVDFALKMKS